VTIEIWSDIVCPWCYIGKRRFESALARFEHRAEVEVLWRSFELDPDAPLHLGMPLDQMLAQKYGMSVSEAKTANARVTKLARDEGLDYHLDTAQPGNSFSAHRLVHFAGKSGLAPAMHERLMKAYFTDGLAISDHAVLARIAAEIGLDAEQALRSLEANDFAREVRADEERAAHFGISGVPFFAIEERWAISGAEPVEEFESALANSWRELTEAAGSP
jgi:predicted DsbA family dithiol-disulfide isomerase